MWRALANYRCTLIYLFIYLLLYWADSSADIAQGARLVPIKHKELQQDIHNYNYYVMIASYIKPVSSWSRNVLSDVDSMTWEGRAFHSLIVLGK